jgi:hypothetical protein
MLSFLVLVAFGRLPLANQKVTNSIRSTDEDDSVDQPFPVLAKVPLKRHESRVRMAILVSFFVLTSFLVICFYCMASVKRSLQASLYKPVIGRSIDLESPFTSGLGRMSLSLADP